MASPSASASSRPAGAVATAADVYQPRRSNHVRDDAAQHDGDCWEERLAVVDKAMLSNQAGGGGGSGTGAGGNKSNSSTSTKLVIRSYYRNKRTGERVWDEPPTGASQVRHASAEMRDTSTIQMQELQSTLDAIPPETEEGGAGHVAAAGTGGKGQAKDTSKKKGFFGLFRKKKKDKYIQRDVSQDLNLQKALAQSMMESRGGPDSAGIYYDPESAAVGGTPGQGGGGPSQSEEEAIAMAQALSISETGIDRVSEEEMLQRALEASQEESERAAALAGVAAMPASKILPTRDNNFLPPDDSSSSLSWAQRSPRPRGMKSDPNERFEQQQQQQQQQGS